MAQRLYTSEAFGPILVITKSTRTIMDPISFTVGMIGAALVGKVYATLIKANNDSI